jgi:isorenieratene synthase
MRLEYTLFDLFIACPLVAIAWLRPAWASGVWRPALWATIVGAVPFVLWDALVTDRHWWFEDARVLGVRLWGLPLEELGFFVLVPLACIITWELVMGGARASPRGTPRNGIIAAASLVAAVILGWLGREYTALCMLAIAVASLLDAALATRLASSRTARLHALVVLGLTTVFNGYLTARPIVSYDPRYQLDVRIGTIPIEDYAFGLALVWVTTALYQWRRGRTFGPSWLARAIRARFGGYVHRIVEPDGALPERLERAQSVVVIGGGLAGLTAAELLSRRGFAVELVERDHKLGGKLAGWTERLDDGFDAPVEHGFHAFFRHYYNLGAWMRELGLDRGLRAIDDYAILTRSGERVGFADAPTTPLLNLVGLASLGFFRWRDVMAPQTGRSLEALLRYDAAREDPKLDTISFAQWADEAKLPPRLRMVFTTFARAFFADEARISMAELVKSFHFYYLGHDRGLLYDHLDGSSDETFVDPIVARLAAQGVVVRIGEPVARIDRAGDRFTVNGRTFDHIVLATDVAASSRIVAASPALSEIAPAFEHMHAGQRYAVVRLWVEQPLGEGLPTFVITERERTLDAIAMAHRTDPRVAAWSREHTGSVLELHCYAVPDDIADADVVASMIDEAERYVPGLADAVIAHRHVELRRDFTALHVGMRAHRPGTSSGVQGLVFAGDWVKLPCPAMLMEAAHTSARYAVNEICSGAHVRGFEIDSVPLQGVLVRRSAR